LTVARLDGNLLDASLVTAAFEIGGEELFDEFHCLVVGDETGGQHDHVRVVVLADQVGDLLVPYESRTDALVLVEGDGQGRQGPAADPRTPTLAVTQARSSGIIRPLPMSVGVRRNRA
jgi:hypothetical protein